MCHLEDHHFQSPHFFGIPSKLNLFKQRRVDVYLVETVFNSFFAHGFVERWYRTVPWGEV